MAQTDEDRWLERIRPTLDTVMREDGDGVPLPPAPATPTPSIAEIRAQAFKVKPVPRGSGTLARLEAMSRNLALAVDSGRRRAGHRAERVRGREREARSRSGATWRQELTLLHDEYASALRWLGVLGNLRRDLP